MDNTTNTTARAWNTSPTTKEKSTVQRSVNQLLDVLAPERVVRRGDAVPSAIEPHRTPNGCVLQAEDSAISVSWFADNRGQTLGELHVNVWNGVVTRGGSSHRRPAKAELVSELVLKPMEKSLDNAVWRADDGREFDNAALGAHCMALLRKQIAAGDRA